ncbi:uncharacterized protein Dana_GF22450, isoform B [Drosophila ananassae]|nr:uncharacterized protein LOC6505111 isoform X3 [Drosophila ananassae]KPU75369.1 uncharacterized protein Dana_GF22450, isoform B [Drosophila ananassae]
MAIRRHDMNLKRNAIRGEQRAASAVAPPSSPKVVTRSGRTVHVRMDRKFDYSSSLAEDGEDESFSNSLDSDDEDYQLDLNPEKPKWASRKQRRLMSHGSTSSSASDTNSSNLEPEPAYIYLELGQPVVFVRDEPEDGVTLDNDPDLKTKVHKFLGLIAARRRLYNPIQNYDTEEADEEKAGSSSWQRSVLFQSSTPVKAPATAPAPPSRLVAPSISKTTTWSTLNLSYAQPPSVEEKQAKYYGDLVLNANASYMESDTPDIIKEPIDLAGLPPEKVRNQICRRHKSNIACLETNPLFYRFVESLNPAIPSNMCHPLALKYRDFQNCKTDVAKVVFNVFNHGIFHCGLEPTMIWKRVMPQPCICEMVISSTGQRTARILLWEQITQPGMLIKPLLHEMCHAAAFMYNREAGHGDNCRRWAYQARHLMPEVPTIDDCEPDVKYVCTMCVRCSYGRIRFQPDIIGQLRCHYCQFEVTVEPWSTADMYRGTRPDPAMTPFKVFIRENYQKTGEAEMVHSARMRLLNEQYKRLKPGATERMDVSCS